MLSEPFQKALVSALSAFVKKQFKDWRLRKSISEAVHKAFLRQPENLLVMCMNKNFSNQLFRLAQGQTIAAKHLVDLGESFAKDRKLKLSRREIIEELKQFSLALINIFEEIAPEAGKVPSAFNNFLHSVERLDKDVPLRPEEQRKEHRHFNAPHVRNNLLRDEAGSSHVFVSYVREDAEIVDRLADELRKRGVEVWLDRDKIYPGQRWQVAIRRAIQNGNYFIACFSSNYAKREKSYMNEELTIAVKQLREYSIDREWFLPVLLSQCEVPDREALSRIYF